VTTHQGLHASATASLTPHELLLVDAIAQRVAELLRAGPARSRLVDATTVAEVLSVSRDYVYAHASELGGERIGDGPRGRLRFDLDRALAAWTACSGSKESQVQKSPASAGVTERRRSRSKGSSINLLPIRGSSPPDFSDRRSV
jgi:hypothetical protein